MGGADAAAGAVLRTGGAAEDTGAVDALPRGFGTRVVGVASDADCPWAPAASALRGPPDGPLLSRRHYVEHFFQLGTTKLSIKTY